MIARRDLVAGAIALLAAPAAAGPRQPSLQGTWNNASGTPLERPAALQSLALGDAEARAFEASEAKVIHGVPGDDVGQDQAEWFGPDPPLTRIGGRARSSIIVDPADGKLPYSEAGRRALIRSRSAMGDMAGPESRPAPERCMIGFGTPAGAPLLYSPQTNGDLQFIQSPHYLVIRAEANHDLRIVSLDPAAPSSATLRPWMGVSVGRWDGAVLVVETSRFNPEEGLRHIPFGLFLSPDARVVERFHRVSPSEMLYAFEVEDPTIFTRPWRGESLFRASSAAIHEYACHEGNYSIANILRGARRAERPAAAAPP